ncbi:MAG: hypothetical protein JWL69_174 [Phycisphaerales bacterium]|jgi:hypothetical protein|nr:hypothetical protein [Phycisphaerales bacterium]MDB5355983.1 hypothetical protein [Phycisphaerales bacterium]
MAKGDFRWNAWNVDHLARHGVDPREAEHVVRFCKRPYPRPHKKGTWLVIGRGNSNRRVQVIYSLDSDGTCYVIHAMPL